MTWSSVLVPLDGSDKDERALIAAAATAELIAGDIRLIQVVGPPVDSLSPRMQTMGGLDAAHGRVVGASRTLSESVARLKAITGKDFIAEIAEGFDAAQVLIDRSARDDIAIVVMATRAPGTLGLFIRGSVADRVMRESARPVLLVPPGAAEGSEYAIELRRVLVPLDCSRLSVAVLDHLLALDGGSHLEYSLLEVVPPAGSASHEFRDVGDQLRARGARAVHANTVADADAAAAITRAALEKSVDFVAMSTGGASGLRRLVLGSVTEGVVRGCRLPVLLVTGDEPVVRRASSTAG